MKNDKGSVTVILRVKTPPSFKNRKRAIKDRSTGKMRTLTEPSVKKRMKELTDALVSELLSVYRTSVRETSTASSLRSWIACSLPDGDSWKCVPNLQIEAVLTKEPTLTITITEL